MSSENVKRKSDECPKGRLVIVSGPSGAGKSTVVRELLKKCELPLVLSISATTRAPRDAEVPGKDYFFIPMAEFEQRRLNGEFLECKEVFGLGHWYGTFRQQVATGLSEGRWVILEIDVQGAMAILETGEFEPITIFIHPGGMEELEQRLRNRGTEDEAVIDRRLKTAAAEIRYCHRYQYEIINSQIDVAVNEICQILQDHSEKHPCSKS